MIHHVRLTKLKIKENIRELYWLVGSHSMLTIEHKRLQYAAIIKPIWTYRIQLWDCAYKFNIDVIQRSQNITLQTITAAYWFKKTTLFTKINFTTNSKKQKSKVCSQIKRSHDNTMEIQLLENSKDISRHKHLKPYDLVSEFSSSQELLYWKCDFINVYSIY